MPLRTSNITPRIATQLHTDLDTLLSGSAVNEIREILERRGVIVIRGIELTDAQQIAFTRTLGTIFDGRNDETYKVTADEKVNPEYAEFHRMSNFSWHIDRTDLDVPNLCSILRPERLAPANGETQFANTYAAYEDLPEAQKATLDTLRVVHYLASSFRESVPNPSEEQLAKWSSYPPKTHPLVWNHRSGRKSLVTSTSATEVLGMGKEEGAVLLRQLMEWATQPQFVYTHAWQMGDIVLWDNTGTMHRALPYDLNSGRCLRRTTLAGEEALL